MLPPEAVLMVEVLLGVPAIWLLTRCGVLRRSGRRCYRRRRGLTERCRRHGYRAVAATDVWAWALVLAGLLLGVWALLGPGTDWDPPPPMS